MLIHELTQRPEKINEDLKSFFGLNNPAVAQVWDQLGGKLMQDLAARYTKDPKYANMPLAQRKKAMMQDQNIQKIAQQKIEEWQKYITSIETQNRGTPMTSSQYDAAFLNWANQSLFNGKFASLDPAAKAKAQQIFDKIVAHRGDTNVNQRTILQRDLLSVLIADETARAVQVATDLQTAQSAANIQQPTANTPQPAQQGTGYTVQPTQPGYKSITTNAPVAQQKKPAGAPTVNPMAIKKIAANVEKAAI